MTEFLTDADLGDMFGVHESKVAEWRRRYAWPHVKVGREVRYTDADVRAIAAKHHVEGSKAAALPGQTALSAARSS
jgi:uncharacterized protein YjcR